MRKMLWSSGIEVFLLAGERTDPPSMGEPRWGPGEEPQLLACRGDPGRPPEVRGRLPRGPVMAPWQ